VVPGNRCDRRRACLAHDRLKLARQDVVYRLDTLLTERSKPPRLWPADAHGCRAERECLEDFGAAADAAIEQDRDAPASHCRDLGQAFNRRAKRLFIAPAVIRNDDAVRAVLYAQLCILGGHDTLDDQLDGDDLPQPVEVLPRDRSGGGYRGRAASARPFAASQPRS